VSRELSFSTGNEETIKKKITKTTLSISMSDVIGRTFLRVRPLLRKKASARTYEEMPASAATAPYHIPSSTIIVPFRENGKVK